MKKSILLLVAVAALLGMGFLYQDAYAQGAVVGVVIDADGDAVEGAHVLLRGMIRQRGQRPFVAHAETNENGRFGFRQVPQGRYVISAMARELGGAREMIGVRDDQVTEVELQLQGRRGGGDDDEDDPEVGIVGGVITDADGEVVEGARVILVQARGRRGRGIRPMRTESNGDGIYRFADVPEGNYVVMAFARGAGVARARVEVVADEAVRVNLQLEERGGRGGRGGGDE